MFEALHELWYRIRSRFQREDLDAELAEELKAHAAFLEEEAIRGGASHDEARRAAAIRLGNMTSIREKTRERWSFGWIESLLQDTKYAFRFLRRSPGFTAVAILSLALGIGANATVFTVADKLLFSAPAHIADPSGLHLINVQRTYERSGDRPYSSGSFFSEAYALREQAKSFSAVALYTPPTSVRMGRGPDAPRIKESLITADFFDVLGVHPIKGRFLLPDDDTPDASEVAAVISHGFWKKQFGGADSAVGSRYRSSGLNFLIVGVAPKGFTGLELDAADAWIPVRPAAPQRIRRDWMSWTGTVKVVARLRDGSSPVAAAAEATVILRRLPEIKKFGNVQETVALGPLLEARGPGEQSNAVKVSTCLVVAALLVLVVACANLANLLLVRAMTRRREIALRLAVGISRARLVTQMMIESLILAVAGSSAAWLLARWSGDTLRALVFPNLQWGTSTFDVRVFVFASLCGTTVALIATLAPAIRMTRSDVAGALRSAAHQLTASTGRLRQGLLVVQVAMSVVMIIGASAFSRSLEEAYRFDMGLDVDRVITTRMFVESDSLSPAEQLAMLEESARRLRNIPGIERVTLSGLLPLAGSSSMNISNPQIPDSKTGGARWDVTPELLRTLQFHLVRGRLITESDVSRGAMGPIMVTETAAAKLWPNSDPLGQCARIGADSMPCLTVVGVVRDLRQFSLRDKPIVAALVGRAEPDLSFASYIVARTRPGANQDDLMSAIKLALRDVRPDLSSLDVRTLSKALEQDYQPLRLGSVTVGTFALLSIVLAAIGLYGILSFGVAQRAIEFGIRSALGARAGQLLTSAVGESMIVVAFGILVGVGVSWFAGTSISALLFQASARDASSYMYAACILAITAVVAATVPAVRATRVDPATALRAD